ncbi:FG-GAP repeat domain-containing protein [Fimbriiglobus ruber]|uniref:FG-GAP repeat protein n=1 Tax=Fimbriiglobus ruber TaxID=1908690 RepID=A0A225DKJ7_9BACT|nr:VCBS repeat-containing protein [Fimbriiglobus ruber]OWK37709.1 hypothetical protein FRUB_06829 [Fimbriiglobus ruber]
MRRLWILSAGLCAAAVAGPSPAQEPVSPSPITWKKTVLDRKFRSEGVAVADVNKDGKKDVMNGEYWYEAPEWTPHEMQPPVDHKDGLGNYSRVFACWAEDLNKDGYPDLIVIDFPGAPCYWLENPKDSSKHWTRHTIWHSACNETPQYLDLLGTGQRVLIMGTQPTGKKQDGNEGQMAYFTPDPKDPNALWILHPISPPSESGKTIPGTNRFSHGLGVGDINGDGKGDVICTDGWWEQPAKADGTTPWVFHPANLGPAASDMYAVDMDGDGLADVLSTSAHKFGIWWHKQGPTEKNGNPKFTTVELYKDLLSETHAAHFVDINGDGLKDLVTGKRWWSHGRGEPGSDKPAMIYWFQASKGADKKITFTPHVIDDDSGVGTQFEVTDINGDGLLDVVVSNKKGVKVIIQERK